MGADLAAVCSEAAMQQVREKVDLIGLKEGAIDSAVLESLCVNMDNFRFALEACKPLTLRKVAVEVPTVTWHDVGGLESHKQLLREIIQNPINHPDIYMEYGVSPRGGILMCGPPGTGKKLLAMAIANECQAAFIGVKVGSSCWIASLCKIFHTGSRAPDKLA